MRRASVARQHRGRRNESGDSQERRTPPTSWLARMPDLDEGRPYRESEALGGVVRRRVAARPRTAFVLAGGASLGGLQVGMLRALYERGIVPDLLVGTSVGALNAAFVASRPQIPDTADELACARGARLQRGDVFPASASALICGATGRRNHLFPDRGLRHLLRRHLEVKRLEEARIPLHVCTFDVLSGEEVRLSDGPVIEAVLASVGDPRRAATCHPRRPASGRRRSRQPRADLACGRARRRAHLRAPDHPARFTGAAAGAPGRARLLRPRADRACRLAARGRS